MSDIIDIAISQIGTSESNNGQMKYINWYGGFGSTTPWCAIFVSWCANQAGVSTSIVPKFASTSVGLQWFKNKGLYKGKGSYTPKRGDIVFFTNNRSHTALVEKVENSTLYTVEGNTSDKVAKRTYQLDESTLTGYGVPAYSNSVSSGTSSSTSNSSTSNSSTSSEELEYLKTLLKNMSSNSTTSDVISGYIEVSNTIKDVNVSILIKNGKKKFYPTILDDLRITWERKGTPGKLTFKTIIDSKYTIQEGNEVLVILNNKKIFYGFVFTKKQSKDNLLELTVYDQLRYLKNKDTIIYYNKTSSQLIKMIAEDYQLNVGTLDDTKYSIAKKIEEDTTLFDIIQNSLDETMMTKNMIYVLYDNVGKLTLKNVANMKVNNIIDSETAQDFSYQSSIDENTYNQIKLGYENTDTNNNKILDTYVVRDKNKISQWGLLQYYEKIDDPKIAVLKANALLEMYNKKTRSISISNAIGNINVRAGALIPVFLKLVDTTIMNYLLVEKVTHKFTNKVHTMDLTLSGGDFVA